MGGLGYIGSHTAVALLQTRHSVVVIDNLSNSSRTSIERAEEIHGQRIPFYKADIRDREELNKEFSLEKFDCCIHFAGLKAVGESVKLPWEYYDNNVVGTRVLLDVLHYSSDNRKIETIEYFWK